MSLRTLLPAGAPDDPVAVLTKLADAPAAAPFAEETIDFCDALSRRLFRDPRGRQHPELHVLAFWLRKASTVRLREAFEAETPAGALRVARGVVFHVPPTNVDTMAVYSLALSMLAGNRNVVRVSESRTELVDSLVEALGEVLADDRFAALREGTAVVAYGHEPEPTEAASARCDVRVVWGGDATVERLRGFPLAPHAKEIVFADRFSFAVASAPAWIAAGDDERDELVRGLYDDAYWFDQMGCSSPRLLVWVGDSEAAEAARADLAERLPRLVGERGYALEPGAVSAKLTYAFGAAIDRPLDPARLPSPEVTILPLRDLADFDRTHPGAGLFFEAVVPGLADVARFVVRKDQTMTAFGFSEEELRAFARGAAGRGIDRIVPFGQALSFDRLWDGMDLLAELTRLVVVDASGRSQPARPDAASR